MLRTNLDFATIDHDVRSIMVTSAQEQEGKSTTAANLAVMLAREGGGSMLVDLDLRRPFLHKFFDLGSSPGSPTSRWVGPDRGGRSTGSLSFPAEELAVKSRGPRSNGNRDVRLPRGD